MGYSRNKYPYSGGDPVFQIDFALGYLDPNDVTLHVEGEVDGLGQPLYRSFTWVDDSNIRAEDPLPAPCTVIIDRTVDKDTLEIDLNGIGEVTRDTLERAFLHLMMNFHEILDGRITQFSDLPTLVNFTEVAADAAAAAMASEGEAEDAAAAAAMSAAEIASRLEQVPSLSFTTTTGEPGSAATISYNAETGVASVTVPRGDKGEKGDKGDPGAPGEDGKDGESVDLQEVLPRCTRAFLVTIPEAYSDLPDGAEVMADGFLYRRKRGARDIPDLPGWQPAMSHDGFVHVRQFGAVPDCNRHTGRGTDSTAAIRAALNTWYHIDLGLGNYRVTGTLHNLIENRKMRGTGMGVVASSKETVSHFNAPTSLVATDRTHRVMIENETFDPSFTERWAVQTSPVEVMSASRIPDSPAPYWSDMPAEHSLRIRGTGDAFFNTNLGEVDPTQGDILVSGDVFFHAYSTARIELRVQWKDANGDNLYMDGQGDNEKIHGQGGGHWYSFVRRFTPPPNAASAVFTPDYLGGTDNSIFLTNLHVEQAASDIIPYLSNYNFVGYLGDGWTEMDDPEGIFVANRDTSGASTGYNSMPNENALRFNTSGTGRVQSPRFSCSETDYFEVSLDYLIEGSGGGFMALDVFYFNASGTYITYHPFEGTRQHGQSGSYQRITQKVAAIPGAAEVMLQIKFDPSTDADLYVTNVSFGRFDPQKRRVITRRKFRSSRQDENDRPYAAVLENWGGGSTFYDFSIECQCDYTDFRPDNFGANFDIGFFNGCRGSTGCRDMSINGYFRRASFYWDGTDAYGIPNHYDIYGKSIPLNGPSGFGDPTPEDGGGTVRSSGMDHCWMYRCEARGGRVGRAILGAGRDRTGADYYDYRTSQSYEDFRGGSGVSDFRSRDCILYSVNHHSGWRVYDPIGFGTGLTQSGMDNEPDDAPAAQHVDWWAKNVTQDGPGDSGRGLVFDDMRYNSWEAFITRWGACHEVYIGPRVWTETGDGLYTVRDTQGNPISNTYDDDKSAYLPLATDDLTGTLRWDGIATKNLDQKWVRNWAHTTVTDRLGRERGPMGGMVYVSAGQTVSVYPAITSGFMSVSMGAYGDQTPISAGSAHVYIDLESSSKVLSAGFLGEDIKLVGDAPLTNSNVADGQVGIAARSDGSFEIRNRHASGGNFFRWKIT